MITALALALLLVFLRVGGFVAFLPPFSGANVPNTVKVGLVVALTALWGAKVIPGVALSLNPAVTDNWMLLVWLGIRETMFGAALGWLLGLILVPVRVAGAYIVQEMGLTMAAVTSATEPGESNVVSQLLEVAAVLFFFGSNMHHEFLRLFNVSFDAFPLGRTWVLPEQSWIIGSILKTTHLGLGIAAPVGIILFACMVATLFIMRQTPQFNLFTFGGPIRLIVGLGGMIWFLPSMLAGMVHSLQSFVRFSGL
ncbi:flagellar biosynthetic protein FliR [Planctomicrobium sp. SH661]|uniref:flagellar biosynthetic protein FliR n=1 Tax=Planctomicrobium sp. SH661 TaxID=3448124 RepID=UPI003F5B3B1F